MREYTISKKEAGQRMDKYLFKALHQAPKSFVYRMLRKKNIVLNGRKASGGEILRSEDRISIFFSDETFQKFAPEREHREVGSAQNARRVPLSVVYEDEDILVINKPAGILSQKAAPADYSANEMVIDYLLESGQITERELQTFRPSVCNRLDRNTSGLLIAGKTMRGLQETSRQLRSRSVQKYYRCLVLGDVREEMRLFGYLTKNHRTNEVTVFSENPKQALKKGEHAAKIETVCRPLWRHPALTLLEVHLITGRSHQIRAHLASVGHPILGDRKYGNARANRLAEKEFGVRGQLLHAFRMEFPDGKILTAKEPQYFTMPARKKMAAALAKDF